MASVAPDISIFLMWMGGGGKETVVRHLAQGFADAGYRVDLVLGNAAGAYRDKIPSCVRVVDLKTGGYLRTTLKLAGYLRRHRPSAFFSTLPFSALPAIVARTLARTRCRTVVRVCNNMARRIEYEPDAFPRTVRWALRLLPRWADEVVACSTGIAREISGITRIPFDRIRILYNPAITADMHRLGAAPTDHEWFTEPGERERNRPVILGIGRLARQKNFAMLIRALVEVRQEVDARLLILGEGPERPELERLVQELGLEDSVSLPGYVTNPYAYLARARVFALSSSWEGFANVVAEALAMGTPVVATDCPSGPAEVLADGRYGLLVPVGDSAAMADGIRRVLAGEVPNVSDDWLRRFTTEDVVGRYLSLFGLPRTNEAIPNGEQRIDAAR